MFFFCYLSWLEVYLSLVGNLMILFAAVFAILARDSISAGVAGLSISFALNVSSMLNHLVTMSTQLESNMTSVERVKEYCQTPSEVSLLEKIKDLLTEYSKFKIARLIGLFLAIDLRRNGLRMEK
jgi:ABC-type multidrug transport system fused ATPase/permease subunit